MLSTEQLKEFDTNGYVVLKNFISLKECMKLRNECDKIIESNHFVEEANKISVFSAGPEETRVSDMYFLTSTDKIRPFLEKRANEIIEKAKNESNGEQVVSKKNIFNKIGHALHALNPEFKAVTFGSNVKGVFQSLGYEEPIVCQSMYIFKQPYIGGEVQPHQDGSYLHVQPLKIAGVWIALEDCTLENGCLSFIPGSHKGRLDNRFIRNSNKEEFDNGKYLIYTNSNPAYDPNDFVPVPVKAGDAVVIDGLVVHQSEQNLSSKSRHIYTFHVYESKNAVFSKDNWMEYSEISFLPLYEN